MPWKGYNPDFYVGKKPIVGENVMLEYKLAFDSFMEIVRVRKDRAQREVVKRGKKFKSQIRTHALNKVRSRFLWLAGNLQLFLFCRYVQSLHYSLSSSSPSSSSSSSDSSSSSTYKIACSPTSSTCHGCPYPYLTATHPCRRHLNHPQELIQTLKPLYILALRKFCRIQLIPGPPRPLRHHHKRLQIRRHKHRPLSLLISQNHYTYTLNLHLQRPYSTSSYQPQSPSSPDTAKVLLHTIAIAFARGLGSPHR